MRIIELIYEAISVTQVGFDVQEEIKNKLPLALSNWVERNIQRLSMAALAQDYNASINNEADTELIEEFLRFFLSNILTRKCQAVTNSSRSTVSFDELPNNINGQEYNGSIVINEKYLMKLSVAVQNVVYEYYVNNGYTVVPIEWHNLADAVYPFTAPIARIFVHELTHVEQHARSYTKTATGYRSYLERDKRKFYDMIKKGEHGAAYLTSPQEIAAFAQDHAYSMLEIISDERTPLRDKIDILISVMKELSSRSSRYDDPALNKSDKIHAYSINRFLKRVYQELSKHLDQLKNQYYLEVDKAEQDKIHDNPPQTSSGDIDWDKYDQALTKQALSSIRKKPTKSMVGFTKPELPK